MLTPEEENFLKYWEDNRNKPATSWRPFRIGLSIGMVFGVGILLNFATGWYSRANMVANSQSTPLVLMLAIVIISVFCSFLYRQFSRENNEQRYKELLAKKEKHNKVPFVQQDALKNSQSNNP